MPTPRRTRAALASVLLLLVTASSFVVADTPPPKSGVHDMRDLAIGKVAPEIEGEDVDGKTFKLSEYRGKVVVLDFWGDW